MAKRNGPQSVKARLQPNEIYLEMEVVMMGITETERLDESLDKAPAYGMVLGLLQIAFLHPQCGNVAKVLMDTNVNEGIR